jgi:tRNA threonylcarbamoyl adenosine modification protein YjeE
MNDITDPPMTVAIHLQSPQATADLASWLAPQLCRGDVLLLEGPIGAGKSHFSRALIKAILAMEERYEDVPSPTFTLVQVYELDAFDIWHADLYRLTDPEQAIELGLDDAFEDALCLIEWPDRLGNLAPQNALLARFMPIEDPDARRVTFHATNQKWAAVLRRLESRFEAAHG